MGFFDFIQSNVVYFILALLVIQFISIFFVVHVNMKYNRLKRSYRSFMKGKDGKNLEESVLEKFSQVESVMKEAKKNQKYLKMIQNKMKRNYQKTGLVKYDAFEGMEGKLSFALTMLDDNNNGWILDVMNTEKENHSYLKEIINGESYIELTNEERESLEHAIFQENYDIRDMENIIENDKTENHENTKDKESEKIKSQESENVKGQESTLTQEEETDKVND